MKNMMKAVVLLVGMLSYTSLYGQDRGETLFKQTCVACHTIGQGKLIGPDLANVRNRRDEAWLIRFIRSSQKVIAGGDPEAVALFEQYNRIVMPDHALSDDDVRAILGYIARMSASGAAPAASEGPSEEAPPTDEAVARGRALFVGEARFAAGGPACNSCHTVRNGDVMTGGSLAKDLTDAYSRLGAAGIRAIVSGPPFPPMQAAYGSRPLSEDEVDALIAFLGAADQARPAAEARSAGTLLFVAGLLLFVVIMGLFAWLGAYGAKPSVNRRIFERQLKSA
ncbi:c-type cytochrome [Rhodocaloribacter sp.]